MFDSPGVTPCCLAPVVGVLVGALVYRLTLILGNKKSGPKSVEVYPEGLFVAIVTAIIAIIPACFILSIVGDAIDSPYPWFMPSNDAISGTYQLDQTSSRVTFPAHELTFTTDGTFTVTHMPDFWVVPGKWNVDPPIYMKDLTYIDGSGVWHVEKDPLVFQDEWIIIADFRWVND